MWKEILKFPQAQKSQLLLYCYIPRHFIAAADLQNCKLTLLHHANSVLQPQVEHTATMDVKMDAELLSKSSQHAAFKYKRFMLNRFIRPHLKKKKKKLSAVNEGTLLISSHTTERQSSWTDSRKIVALYTPLKDPKVVLRRNLANLRKVWL